MDRKSLSRETILNSFKVCGLTNDLDCSEDSKINIFNDGKCCAGELHEFHNELGKNTDERNVVNEVVDEGGEVDDDDDEWNDCRCY